MLHHICILDICYLSQIMVLQIFPYYIIFPSTLNGWGFFNQLPKIFLTRMQIY